METSEMKYTREDLKNSLESLVKILENDYGLYAVLKKAPLSKTGVFLTVASPKETWANGIIQNASIFMIFQIDEGTIELLNKSYKMKEIKFRKMKFSNPKHALTNLEKYFNKNETKLKELL